MPILLFRFVFICLFLSFVGQSQAQDWRVYLRCDSTQILIGDQLQIELWAEAKAEDPQEEPEFPADAKSELETAGWEVLSVSDVELFRVGGEPKLKQRFAITAWEQGVKEIPAFRWLLPSGEELKSSSLRITIQYPPQPTGDSLSIADIKPILETPMRWTDYLPLLLVLALLPLLLLLAWYLYRRFKAGQTRPQPSPEELAWEALRAFDKEDYLGRGDYREHHARLSYILRQYLGRRFVASRALESPVEEFLQRLPKNYLARTTLARIEEVLRTADLIKFAKASPLAAANREARDLLKQVLEQMAKKLAEEEEKARQASRK